jgi:hypothetical protein
VAPGKSTPQQKSDVFVVVALAFLNLWLGAAFLTGPVAARLLCKKIKQRKKGVPE